MADKDVFSLNVRLGFVGPSRQIVQYGRIESGVIATAEAFRNRLSREERNTIGAIAEAAASMLRSTQPNTHYSNLISLNQLVASFNSETAELAGRAALRFLNPYSRDCVRTASKQPVIPDVRAIARAILIELAQAYIFPKPVIDKASDELGLSPEVIHERRVEMIATCERSTNFGELVDQLLSEPSKKRALLSRSKRLSQNEILSLPLSQGRA